MLEDIMDALTLDYPVYSKKKDYYYGNYGYYEKNGYYENNGYYGYNGYKGYK